MGLCSYRREKRENFPAIVPYVMLSSADHWVEVTGEPVWKFYKWTYSEPSLQAKRYRQFFDAMSFDYFQPWFAPSREDRENNFEAMLLKPIGPVGSDKGASLRDLLNKWEVKIIINAKDDADVQTMYNQMMTEAKAAGYGDIIMELYNMYLTANPAK